MKILDTNKLPHAYNRILTSAGYIALRFVKDRFVYKNWLDTSREPWKPRTRADKGSLLVRTGTLKRSIRIQKRTNIRIVIATDSPYAQIHNEGGTIATTQNVRAHRRSRHGSTHHVRAFSRHVRIRIPPRPFLKNSTFLEKKIERMMEIEITNALKKFNPS